MLREEKPGIRKKGRSMKKDDPKIQSIFEKDSGDVIEAKQQKGKWKNSSGFSKKTGVVCGKKNQENKIKRIWYLDPQRR
jgi:hypothetical protein